ncbi:MAG: TonB-dependent receptor [Bacteroidota bacterium]|nr:TonB-dependent receptor [Bacteroidota bacterium]
MFKQTKYIVLLASLLLFCGVSFSQTGSIRGFIYDEDSGEPIIFTNAYLKGTTRGATTDVNGFFAITNIPAGDYVFTVTYMGYNTLEKPMTVYGGDITSQKFYLKASSYQIEGVSISAGKIEATTETKTSVVKLTPAQINKIPSVGGQPDIAQYLQVIPGVVFTGDQGGQLYIRGGSPIQNKVLLDGMTIYNPFHSIGMFSVFDTDILRSVDVYTGGFGAEFGGRISSIMDMTTKDGNKKRIAGSINASTFGAKVTLEGPLKKQKSNSGSSSSFIISAKNSYLDKTDDNLYSYVNENGLPFSYSDFYGKVSLNSSNGSKVNFFGFNYTDNVKNYQSLSDFNWDAVGAGSNFVLIPGNSPVLVEGHIAYSRYEMSLLEENSRSRTSSINGFNLGLDFTYIKEENKIKYGIELNGFSTDFYFYNKINRKIQQQENTTELSGYLKDKIVKGKWIFEPGVRLQWYASLSEFSFEPRFAMKYNTTDKLRLKLAGGWYSQNLISARFNNDVVNLFYGFLSGPDNLPKTFDGEEVTSKLQKAQHIIAGVEYDFTDRINLNVEGYFKNFSQLTNVNKNKIYDSNNQDAPDELKKDFIVESGKAYGADMTLNYKTRYFSLMTVYSHSYVTRFDGEKTYYPFFDRRHNVNMVLNYTFGKNKDWTFNARWNLGSGFPFTQTQGAYGSLTFPDGTSTDYTTVNEEFDLLYADYNEARLSYYHKLDLGISKIFYFGKHTEMELNASVTNVYDRNNVFYFDRISNERVNQLPIMPSFGLKLTF